MATQAATFPASAPASAGILLPAFTLWWREVVRFYRQRARVVGVIASPLIAGSSSAPVSERHFAPDNPLASRTIWIIFIPGVLVMIILFAISPSCR